MVVHSASISLLFSELEVGREMCAKCLLPIIMGIIGIIGIGIGNRHNIRTPRAY